MGNTHPQPGNGLGRDSATETILSRLSREKGEKVVGVFCSRDKRLQLSTPGDRMFVANPT